MVFKGLDLHTNPLTRQIFSISVLSVLRKQEFLKDPPNWKKEEEVALFVQENLRVQRPKLLESNARF